MPTTCKVNNWVIDGVSIAIQVTFIFAFLTVFFFAYVQEVEKTEFQSQLNLIVDSLAHDIKENSPTIESQLSPENTVVLIHGIIGVLQEKIVIGGKGTVQDVLKQNRSVKMKALKSLVVVIAVVVGVAIIILLSGYCVPIHYQIKEAMLVVVFVGLTELIFLEMIAKHFVSASPNKVKRSLAQAVQNWIKEHHKL